MLQKFGIRGPELLGFSVLGATIGTVLTGLIAPGVDSHGVIGLVAGALGLPMAALSCSAAVSNRS